MKRIICGLAGAIALTILTVIFSGVKVPLVIFLIFIVWFYLSTLFAYIIIPPTPKKIGKNKFDTGLNPRSGYIDHGSYNLPNGLIIQYRNAKHSPTIEYLYDCTDNIICYVISFGNGDIYISRDVFLRDVTDLKIKVNYQDKSDSINW